jgi:pimeloyl-ACP methyl ester carboxylesterase
MILDSVVDPDDRDPFGLAGFRAMAPSLAALCPAGCRDITRDPAADLARLTARLGVRPLHGTAFDRHGRAHRVEVGPTALADLLYDADYNPPLRSGIPSAVLAALHGDSAPLARLVLEGDGLADLPAPRSFSSARYATICEETPLPWDAATPFSGRLAEAERRAAAVGPGAFFPFDFRTAAADEIGLCLDWPGVPSGAVPAPGSGYPAVPTLLLQGGEDLRTPPESSADVASKIPGAVRVVVPGVGHAVVGGDPSGCGVRALGRFLDGLPVASTCPRVGTGVPDVAIPPRRFSSLRAIHGLPPRVGRTAEAIRLTVDDLVFALSPAFLSYSGGGLRGGSFAVRRDRVVIDRYSAVDGVRITGVARRRVLRLRIAGPAAAAGSVSVANGTISGRLGGRRVHLRYGGASGTLARVAAATAQFRAPFAREKTRPRLVPTPRR